MSLVGIMIIEQLQMRQNGYLLVEGDGRCVASEVAADAEEMGEL